MYEKHHGEEVHLLSVTLEDDEAGSVRRSSVKGVNRKFTLHVLVGLALEVERDVDL